MEKMYIKAQRKSRKGLMNKEKFLKQLKAMSELRSYIENLPFEKYELTRLVESVDREINIIEYSIVKELGTIEMQKLKASK